VRAIIALRSKLSQDVIDSGRFVGKPEVIQTGSGDQYREVGFWEGYR
jgi:hypothetical protein